MLVTAIDLYLLDPPLREPFVTGHGEVGTRPISVVRVSGPDGHGWGECAALPTAGYTAESAADSFEALATDLAPALLGTTVGSGELGELLAAELDRRPMAVAALEMALLDAELRLDGRSLGRWLGAERTRVPAGVSVGMDEVARTVERVRSLAGEGYRRVKLKIEPGHDLDLVTEVRDAVPGVELHLDANGTYRAGDIDVLCELAATGVRTIEQPFAPPDRDSAAALISRLAGSDGPAGETGGRVLIVADEAVATAADAEALLAGGAMTALSIKPARVGGLLTARRLHDLCLLEGVPATAGGMLETGLGRRALAAVAALPGFTLTGDLSPAGRWLGADPWTDLTMVGSEIEVPDGPGIAPDPDPVVLEALTIDRRTIA